MPDAHRSDWLTLLSLGGSQIEVEHELYYGFSTAASTFWLTMIRSMLRALPVCSSQSIATPHSFTSPVAGSKRLGTLVRKRCNTNFFSTPITLSYGPVMPTSVW